MLDVGCWMLDAGCWMLDAGCWMLDVGCWMLDVWVQRLGIGCVLSNFINFNVLLFKFWTIKGIKAMNYEDLEIWKIANEIVLQIHQLTINDIPKFEMFETGSQIRRSIKSVKANIVEGYGRKQYKQEFIRFLVMAQASNDETIDHLKTLYNTRSLTDNKKYEQCLNKLEVLGKKINRFITSVKKGHRS